MLEEADEATILTVWIPLNEATIENGCLQVFPRSHRDDLIDHCPTDNGMRIPDAPAAKQARAPADAGRQRPADAPEDGPLVAGQRHARSGALELRPALPADRPADRPPGVPGLRGSQRRASGDGAARSSGLGQNWPYLGSDPAFFFFFFFFSDPVALEPMDSPCAGQTNKWHTGHCRPLGKVGSARAWPARPLAGAAGH